MKQWLTGTMAALLCGGCVFFAEPYRETVRYDLLPPAAGQATVPGEIAVEAFRNLSPASRKLLYREADGRLMEDPYAMWAQPPELLLQRYLADYFSTRVVKGGANMRWVIDGTLFKFELDRTKKTAELGVNFEIRCYVNGVVREALRGNRRFSAPMPETDGAGATAAMSGCVAALAQALEKQMADAAPQIEKNGN